MQSHLASALRHALRPYQYRWIQTALRYPLVAHLGARKIGKDYSWTSLPALEALTSRCQWNLFSATQTHASEVLRDVRRWIEALQIWYRDRTGKHLPTIKLDNVRMLELSNGSKIFSHPATLRGAVGLRGSVIFNEVGQIPHAQELYEGVYPTVSASLRDGHPSHLIIISNATYQGHWWHKWWEGIDTDSVGSSAKFAKITTTLRQQLESMGHPPEAGAAIIEEEQQNLGRDAYAQWMDCQWRHIGGSFFGDLPVRCSYKELPSAADRGRHAGCTLGYDLGRVGDPAAIAPLLLTKGKEKRYCAPIWSQAGWDYKSQRLELQRQADMWGPAWGVWADGTGSQCGLVEEIQRDRDVRISPIVGVPFGMQSKWSMFSKLRAAMQEGRLLIPADTDLHMELSAIYVGRTDGGQPTLKWGRKKDSQGQTQHGDRAVALALANWGADSGSTSYWLS